VRPDPAGDVDGFLAVACLACDLHVGLAGDQCGEAGADSCQVVGDDDADHVPGR
jgi:hypothetical protein